MPNPLQNKERIESQRILSEKAHSLRGCATDSTPAKNKYGPGLVFGSKARKLEDVRRKLGEEMEGRWLGPMPVEEFFQNFLPPVDAPLPRTVIDPFEKVSAQKDERLRYDPFVKAIRRWIPHLEAVNTSCRPDMTTSSMLKTDISLYKRVKGKRSPNWTDFSQMELWIEFKNKEAAFKDPEESESETENERLRLSAIANDSFTPSTDKGLDERGQLAHYAGALHSKQFRHFSYSILVEGDSARFLRWEPTGTIVTAGFNYRTNPEVMAEFLWRFDHLAAKDRGHDDSVRLANLPHDVDMRVRETLGMKDKDAPLYEYTLPGLIDKGYAYGPMPQTQNRSLVSRCTRNLPVYWIPDPNVGRTSKSSTDAEPSGEGAADAGTNKDERKKKKAFETEGMIYMKDTWRFLSDLPGIEIKPEHEIYEMLHECDTPHIPEDVAGGDVPGGTTRAQDFVDAPWLCVRPRISPYQHYRLVHGIVGRPLSKFRSTKELVRGVLDALEAHKHAFERGEILHRDISAGNIILTDDGRGLLIDWEMARFMGEIVNRRHERTGTWQFMSANLLRNPGKQHALADDLESFVHVLGWMMLRYVPAEDGYEPKDRVMDLEIFDEQLPAKGQFDRGGRLKCGELISGFYPSRQFQPKCPTPMPGLVRTLCVPFKSLYGRPPTDQEHLEVDTLVSLSDRELLCKALSTKYNADIKRLESSSFFIDKIQTALCRDNWPIDDKADANLLIGAHPDNRDNRAPRKTQNTRGLTENFQGLQRGSKRASSPAPQTKSKRLRGIPPDSGPLV